MISALQICKPFNLPNPLYLLVLIAALSLAGCGSQEDTPDTPPPQTSSLSFKLSDTILGSKLNQSTGTLTIFVSVNGGTRQPMNISGDGLTASITLNNIATGPTNFTIDIFYDDGVSGDLQVASGLKTITVVEGSNPTLAFDFAGGSDFDTSFDADGDDLSNLEELDAGLSSPIDASCSIGISLIGSCTLGP